MGLDARVDAAGNVRMTTGEGGPRVLLLCHMDTVPGDLPVRVEDGVLYGRGSVDAKGCLAMAMAAAARMAQNGSGTVEVVAVPDEEGASLGARHLVGGPAPSAVIVGEPSGWQGVTIGYKGALRLRYRHTTAGIHMGADGTNSAEAAVALWNALAARFAEEATAAAAPGLFGVPTATLEAINTSDDGTCLATEMRIDVRLPPGHDTEALLHFLEGLRGDGLLEKLGGEPAVMAPKNTPLVRALLAAIRAEGGEPAFKRKTGTSDMNLVAAAWPHVDVAAYGPGDSRLDHTPLERLDLSEFARAVRVMERVIRRLLEEGDGRSNL
jgi:LysW-gamma-L-lysine carboxypeptidase